MRPAGYTIRSAVLITRPDVHSVMHTHTRVGMALSALRHGLLPLTQHALRFYSRIGYHGYEGIAADLGERERLARDLGPYEAMVLRNHGFLTAGRSIPEAFSAMYYLEKAADAQLLAMQAGGDIVTPSAEQCERTAATYDVLPGYAGRDWQGLIRLFDRDEPDYRT